MAYIGNPIYQSAFVTDQFNGTGAQTAFTMSIAPAGTTNVLIAVSGVVQDPSTYGVVGTTLTFSTAPPSGTGNISCRYLGIPVTGVTSTAYRTKTEFTATAGQTTFTPPSYTVGYIDVFRNGVLLGSADYTASNGTTVVLTTGATSGDLITTESFYVSSVLNAIPNTAGSVGTANIVTGVALTTPTLTSPTIAGTGITFPYGTNPQAAPSKILQVVNSTYNTQTTTTSLTPVATGLTASITPLFSTSKILVLVNCAVGVVASGNGVVGQLWRGGSSIFAVAPASAYINATGVTQHNSATSANYLDSPATTSSTAYTIYFATVNAGTAYFCINSNQSTLTLMEIAQ